MNLVMCALDEAIKFLESRGMTREEAEQKIINYFILRLRYLVTHHESEV